MAQLAIPIVLIGVAYLVSNDEESNKESQKEGFSYINEKKNQGNLLANQNDDYYANVQESSLNMNNEETNTQYQDKYFLNKKSHDNTEDNKSTFENLAGNRVSYKDINHNNMNAFYSSKSHGYNDHDQSSILDSYTGQGTYDIKKEELAPMFKPEDNMQNVYGNQNINDTIQSRMYSSHRHANTKPWEEVKVTPGIGMKYDEQNNDGYNNFSNRNLYTPKNVDELRTQNNPKLVYRLDNHMGPALQPVKNRGQPGKIVKKLPDPSFFNDNQLGMVAHRSGQPMQKPQQMMTCENRDSTSVEYYGARGSQNDKVSYVNGEYMESHKQQLGATPMSNFVNNGVNPTNQSNYSKDSYQMLSNNRSLNNQSHFGNVGAMISNVVEPLFNGLRHSKKVNTLTNQNVSGNMNGGYKQPMVYNPNESVNTTNREMYECKLSMNHLNVQKQDGTAYMNTRPLLNGTQRNSMNQSETGPAQSLTKASKHYEAEYNQRNHNKIHATNVRSNGNMALFNNKVKMIEKNKEICNDRQTPFYNPQQTSFSSATDVLGSFTNMPQEYENKQNSQIEPSLLKAFKQNPYTQSLQSIA